MTSQLAPAQPGVSNEPPTTRERSRRRRKRTRISAAGVVRLLLLFGFAVFCLVPLVWLLFAPTKTNAEMATGNPLSFGSIQTALLAWQHLVQYNGGVVYAWMANSVFYSVGSVVLSVAVAVPAAYALATMRFAGRKLILTLTLVAMVVPATAVVLPLFLELNAVHLTNTAASVILPAAFYPFGVYLAYVYFATSLPRELLEAARIDGCGEVRVFLHTALPLAKPIIAILVFFSFVANWSNYFLPFVMLSDTGLYNLPVGLGNLISGTGALNPAMGATDLPIHYPEAALAGLIVVVPVAILFIAFQRFLIRGLLSGSVKS
ncbi:carbohydrate ABC transporter permease [Microbacterium rhizosphaerae]|uniref:Carbohydrate ABC transporter permease n=1 Tax=Microbacterium rhizosphaerae TaxID=1678237 RepID=A0ABZ0SIF7_9MICO|nr:carbohydrate ABC transporter permease [Microbacterium rhizosphaerae]WPR89127.1 carbohydrate ABC transporter permease [Microbacterium rhizosphaerae]